MNGIIVVSFVHGYENIGYAVDDVDLPALWVIDSNKSHVYDYPFPRNPSDFKRVSHMVSGEMPISSAQNFKKLPRFGLTGLAESGDYIYAGSWNAVYEIRKSDYSLNRIISNRLMNDMHGIWADEDCLITVLTGKDLILMSDYEGTVIDYFSIGCDLSLIRDPSVKDIDWRFISKQFRGSTGYWHFNYVQRHGDEIHLTSRNASAIVVVNHKKNTAYLKLMNHMSPVLIHDGVRIGNQYYFTSVDGKIIISESAESAKFSSQEGSDNVELFTRDMMCKLIRLKETEFGREPNWCRGIACVDDVMYVTVDGRYDTDLSFGLLGLKRTGEKVLEQRLRWSDVGSEKDLRYVTGFDIISRRSLP